MRTNKILCLFLLATSHFVVGMKKTVENNRNDVTVFIDQHNRRYTLKDLKLSPNSNIRRVISSAVKNEITRVEMPDKKFSKYKKNDIINKIVEKIFGNLDEINLDSTDRHFYNGMISGCAMLTGATFSCGCYFICLRAAIRACCPQ